MIQPQIADAQSNGHRSCLTMEKIQNDAFKRKCHLCCQENISAFNQYKDRVDIINPSADVKSAEL